MSEVIDWDQTYYNRAMTVLELIMDKQINYPGVGEDLLLIKTALIQAHEEGSQSILARKPSGQGANDE